MFVHRSSSSSSPPNRHPPTPSKSRVGRIECESPNTASPDEPVGVIVPAVLLLLALRFRLRVDAVGLVLLSEGLREASREAAGEEDVMPRR